VPRRTSRARRFAVAVGIVIAVVVAIAIAVIAPVDDRLYASKPNYGETIAALDSAAAAVAVVHGPLSIGFGEASFTPDLSGDADDWRTGKFPGLPLAGFTARRGAAATGIRDPLWVKSVAVEVAGRRVVLTSVDVLMIPPGVTELLKPVLAGYGLDRSRLYLAATHTHSGPGAWGEGLLYKLSAGSRRDGVERWFAQQIEASIKSAIADLKPAELAEAWVDIPDLTANRTVKDGPPHGGFPILAFRQIGGGTIVLGSYAAHPAMLKDKNLEMSADYPGAWQRAMEQRGFDHALFMAGPVGGQRVAGGARRYKDVDGYGAALADRIAPAIADLAYRPDTDLGAAGVEAVLPELQVRFADAWRLRPWLARLLLPWTPRTYFQAIRIGRTILVSTPADYAGELALPLEAELRVKGFTLAVTSFNGDYIGYIMPSKYDHLDHYETRTMSFFGPGFGDFSADIVARLAAAVSAPPPAAGAPSP
jgi:neutral ceramidase